MKFILSAISPLLFLSGTSKWPLAVEAFLTPSSLAPTKQSILYSSTLPSSDETSNKRKRHQFISDCDDINTPPSLSKIIDSLHSIQSGSDIRGVFINHPSRGCILNVSQAITSSGQEKALTPFAAYCYGKAFAQMVQIRCGKGIASSTGWQQESSLFLDSDVDVWEPFSTHAKLDHEDDILDEDSSLFGKTVICVGRDPRLSGIALTDALCRGIESIPGVYSVYTGLASTPAMYQFCRSNIGVDGAVMVTASHLPEDRNGFKFFCGSNGGLNKHDIDILGDYASKCAREWHDLGIIPPSTTGADHVRCSEVVDYMPTYFKFLEKALRREVYAGEGSKKQYPLEGLKIVLNAGNGCGYFFNDILKELGADVSHSIHLNPTGQFSGKTGIPNPEYSAMIDETVEYCKKGDADIGIMLDTDADRCGFVVPSKDAVGKYEALNRNRLIALLGVIFSKCSPGCTFVTDSVTSEGLEAFLDDLGIDHCRYLKGYANVIGKARDLTESGRALAEVAIETSGHCAMRENGYLDDGTYTAVKVIGLLARMIHSQNEGSESSLLDFIDDLEEKAEVSELRMNVVDESTLSTNNIFDKIAELVENADIGGWDLDEENLEGIRVRIGNGGFFMLRKSLHDPIISLQLEGDSVKELKHKVVSPLLDILEENEISDKLNVSCLNTY